MNLSELAEFTRTILKWLSLGLIVLVSLFIFIKIVYFAWNSLNPPLPPKPEEKFGKLPPIFTQGIAASLAEIRVTLDTIEGVLPKTPTTLPVYKIVSPNPNLLALDAAKKLASSFGFSDEPTSVSSTDFQWTDSKNAARSLVINIVSGNFNLNYDYQKDHSILNSPLKEDQISAANYFKNILKSRGLLPKDLEDGSFLTTPLKISTTTFIGVSSLSEANAIKVDLYRAPVIIGRESNQILSTDPSNALVNAIIVSDPQGKKVIFRINYIYWNIDKNIFSTYPIKTSQQAWEEFRSGGSLKIQVPNEQLTQVSVRQISLGYFDDPKEQKYLQPIFIFEGETTVSNGAVTDFKTILPAVGTSSPSE